jgi:hypothetical protein
MGDESGGVKRVRHFGDGPFNTLMVAKLSAESLAP